ncbi:MAG: DUF5714 domain-containing protein [Methanomicrobiales archaeon]|nr:DUF5714 domain-containing protein [Methanomicrobiales archaeon]
MAEEHRTGCLVCGKELRYLASPQEIACSFCGGVHRTEAACVDGHYVCDRCHGLPAIDVITTFCERSGSRDPVAIAMALMHHPAVKMHGPEHHYLIPAVLLTAWSNARGERDLLPGRLEKARQRSEWVKGGFCGLLGDCGAAVGTGIFVSVVLGATPVSGPEWRLANRMTARALSIIAEHGGPRCCKRNTFLALQEAVAFAREELGTVMESPGEIRCTFSPLNRECRKEECPFHS